LKRILENVNPAILPVWRDLFTDTFIYKYIYLRIYLSAKAGVKVLVREGIIMQKSFHENLQNIICEKLF